MKGSKKLAIIGYGKMGKEVLNSASSFGFDVNKDMCFDTIDTVANAFSACTFEGSPGVIIDFSHKSLTEKLLDEAIARKFTGLVMICTTDIKHLLPKVEELSKMGTVCQLSNTSISAILVRHFAGILASILPQAEVEITETHHSQKMDAPSGTALSIGRAIANARNQDFEEVAVYDRSSSGKRTQEQIGFSCKRGGNVSGEHFVDLYFGHEMVTIGHVTTNRCIFAEGALKICKMLISRQNPISFVNDDNIYNVISGLNV